MQNEIQLLIQNGQTVVQPSVEDGITWETDRKGAPGKLSFTIVKDQGIEFEEGNPVSLIVNGSPLFFGFIFSRKRDKKHQIQVTCYDQLRYLILNKDTYVYENKSASGLLQMIAGDFGLQTGAVDDSGYVIASRTEDNQSLYDIIQNAMDLTLMNTGVLHVLFDDFGKLSLQNMESLKTDVLIDGETGENFDYSSSVDKLTYNKIKLVYDNKETGTREVYMAADGRNQNKWGVLQYFEKLTEETGGQAKAEALLKRYNKPTRTLKLSGCIGSPKVRAGTGVAVQLDLGDVLLQNYMLVEKARHVLERDHWYMDLSLRGGEFTGE